MNMHKKYYYLFKTVVLFCIFVCCACKETEKERIARLVKEWSHKEIQFPSHSILTVLGKDTVETLDKKGKFRIVSYVDSTGCTSCKLQLPEWEMFMIETDSLVKNPPSYHFFFHPKDLKELKYILQRDRFTSPICIDLEDEFNQLNRFPHDMAFHTFLLDSLNRVIAIGNPVHNPNIKDLFYSILNGEKEDAFSPAKSE